MPEHTRDCCVILLDNTQLKVPIRVSATNGNSSVCMRVCVCERVL